MKAQRNSINKRDLTCPGCGHAHEIGADCPLDLVEELWRLVAEGYATVREVSNAS